MPEPSVVEQLPDYAANTLLTSAIVEIESSNRAPERQATARERGKDLVTIVTISQSPSGSGSQAQAQTQAGQASALDQIDILAHL